MQPKFSIRTYRPTDHGTVVSMFTAGVMEPIRTVTFEVFRTGIVRTIWSLGIIGCGLIERYNVNMRWWAISLLLTWTVYIYFMCYSHIRRQFRRHIEMSVKGDLADVVKTYHLREPDYMPTTAACFWIAEARDTKEIIGFLGLDTSQPDGPHLRHLQIKPSYRRLGCARQLLTTAVTRAKQYKLERITAGTAGHLEGAHALYLKAGFVKTAEKNITLGYTKMEFVLDVKSFKLYEGRKSK